MKVELDGVSRRYGATTALEDVSLTVEDGEFFTLVGPSGCGKTTTLRLLAGFEAPTEGTVRFGGADVAGVPPEDRDVGIVFQSYALFPHMTVGENVAYGLRFADPPGGGTDAARVAELLDLVGLGGFEDRDPTALSGGQQQRVALARALAPGPDLLLLDEPMSALDARLRERLRRDVREIQRDLGVTTVYVTHDQAEAMAISDRVAVLSDGRVEQVGYPRELYRRPRTRFVAGFLGENNVFDGRVVDADRSAAPGETKGLSVRVGGSDFRLSRVETPPDGRVTFCVRPGAFAVDAGENRLTGDVVHSEFLGETTRVHLEWESQRVVVALDDPPATDRLTVGFDPDDAWVLE
ncbi:ABC transporter ATP-binding protein [Natronomonas salina]|uniref:ABC transporter ATP-binding protein n=1 Tax=Natronomonas salina TaxID=1710540 RepID=UPI0015B770BF|nr:ABC transporter ATP-binding protein [Natronomonas salina]QLD89717.1 ABC transporter ATP-binding protein [Natronomonas salina]